MFRARFRIFDLLTLPRTRAIANTHCIGAYNVIYTRRRGALGYVAFPSIRVNTPLKTIRFRLLVTFSALTLIPILYVELFFFCSKYAYRCTNVYDNDNDPNNKPTTHLIQY